MAAVVARAQEEARAIHDTLAVLLRSPKRVRALPHAPFQH